MKPVRIAMLGSGFVAEFYMQGLADVPDQEVVVNYSRSAAHAEAFPRKWTLPESNTNMDALIARDDLDLYIIALSNEEHVQAGLKLANVRRNQVAPSPWDETVKRQASCATRLRLPAHSMAMPRRRCLLRRS